MNRSITVRKAIGFTLNALLGATLLFALAPASIATAAPSRQADAPTIGHVKTVLAVATLADVQTAATPGEGVIRITTRVCGNADNWQSVAAANGITAPVYLVLLGQVLRVSCAADTTPAPQPRAPAAAAPAASGWFNPLPGHVSFCNYWEWRGTYNHRGEDIPAAWGTPIHAVHSGTVHHQWDNGGGNMTVITHDGMAEVYMHQSSYATGEGAWVSGGQVIGYVGATGNVTGPHLHLEIQPWGPWNGVTSPDAWLSARGIYIGC